METRSRPTRCWPRLKRELKKTRAEMLQIALPLHKQYFPDHDDHASLGPQERENKIIGEVLHKISDDHPKRDDLMQTVKDDLVGIRQFIIDKKIVSLKSRDNLKVIRDAALHARHLFGRRASTPRRRSIRMPRRSTGSRPSIRRRPKTTPSRSCASTTTGC